MDAASDVAQLLKVYWPLFLGNIVEWYEFAVYGYLETYLESSFFRGSAVATWLGFTVTFLARPLGGVVLGIMGDRLGRRTAVNVSIVGMLVGTCGQGLLPTYASGVDAIGHAGVAMLLSLRFLQGLSAAGEISTISTYVTEVAPPASLGRSISLIPITANLGFLSAKAAVFLMSRWIGEEAMQSWGWRVPFLLALLPGLVAVWGRRALPESEQFLEQKLAQRKGQERVGSSEGAAAPTEWGQQDLNAEEDSDCPEGGTRRISAPGLQAAAGKPSIRGHAVLLGMLGLASHAVLGYGGFVWVQSYLVKHGMSPANRMLTDLCARGLMIMLALPVGWLADIQGVGWFMFVGALMLALGGLPFFAMLAAQPTNLAVSVGVIGFGLAMIGAIGGTVSAVFVTELFPTAVRASGVGIAYNLGFCLFGGLSPVVAEASLSLCPVGPGILLSAGGAITATSVATGVLLQRRGLVRLAHVRPQPYFSPCGVYSGKGDDEASDSSSLPVSGTSDSEPGA